ncbi:hypothetical protein [Sciscionella sediminilitoris]|uniref:hypothetical protein n=1 Tax=Sciscionella sediminilitoris TaxID=1445613 RepID=UPI00055B34EB|nr:hypothetical protein [Sciscionella sp. SE31]
MRSRTTKGIATAAIAVALSISGTGIATATADTAAPKQDSAAAKSITRGEVIKRAQKWAKNPVPYSMNKYKDGYRTDCSGYVSLAWKLGDSLSTVTLPNVAKPIKKSQLKAGDILGNLGPGTGGAAGHVVIFEKWANKEHTAYWTYEQTPPHTMHHKVSYPGHKNFKPYRYKNIKD